MYDNIIMFIFNLEKNRRIRLEGNESRRRQPNRFGSGASMRSGRRIGARDTSKNSYFFII